MLKYSILIQYDDTDNIYVAKIPELQGCMAHGKTYEDAMREIKIALELWIETAKDNEINIPEPVLFAV